ncbi:hypothetical protein [Virgibacillus sp. CBA3643]|uniref:hypothetical protein n=1 Tax=Virgibacillus sp. CBA3643 TaxID=2942278 RepID=UPI0035A36070
MELNEKKLKVNDTKAILQELKEHKNIDESSSEKKQFIKSAWKNKNFLSGY